MTRDEKIQDIAVSYVRRNSAEREWEFTKIGALHPKMGSRFRLDEGELVIVSGFYSDESWHVFTTRRIAACFEVEFQSLDPSNGVESDFENFKGYDEGGEDVHAVHVVKREIATIKAIGSEETVRFEFETWKEAMPPMYAALYWTVKHPHLDKLMPTAKWQEIKRKGAARPKPGFKRWDTYGFKNSDVDAARTAFESAVGVSLKDPFEDRLAFRGRNEQELFALSEHFGATVPGYSVLLRVSGKDRRRDELQEILEKIGFVMVD